MAQPDMAAGGDGNPADANPATPFEDIAAEMLGEEQEEEQPVEDDAEAPEAEAEPSEDDLSEEDDEPDLPAIDPPNSLTAEEKEAFKSLPREAQEFTARRIGELEKGFQTKAQEAAQAREAARAEALQFATQLKAEAVQHLEHYAKQFEVRPPDAALFRQNPEAYAQQLETYQYATAQREQAQREADKARAEHEQYQSALQQHEAQEFRQRLQAELPEAYLPDGQNNVEFISTLAATAKVLGYDDNAIQTASVEELKALKTVSEMKAKADKYDAAMRKKMERVRAGKSPPPIAKPGVPRGQEANRRATADQAWQSALTAKTRNAREEAIATWAEKTGWID
jgi:hypothetical protein